MKVPIEISGRHLHLSQKDLEILFGPGYFLRKMRDLTQPEEFAAEETLDLEGEEGRIIKGVRIVGPLREKTQVEVSLTDTFTLKIEGKLRDSGDLEGTPGVTLIGPRGRLKLKRGVIVVRRHLHLNQEEAQEKGLKDGQIISVKVEGERGVIFNQVLVRVGAGYKFCLHLDTDEGNAVNILKRGQGEIIV